MWDILHGVDRHFVDLGRGSSFAATDDITGAELRTPRGGLVQGVVGPVEDSLVSDARVAVSVIARHAGDARTKERQSS